MPNCDWYADLNDHRLVLDFIFDEGGISVFESYSNYEARLREFRSTDEVIKEFDRTFPNGKVWHTVDLRLLVHKAFAGEFDARKIELKPSTGAKWREAAEGLGLIHLRLSRPEHNLPSHSNHNSQKRARAWEDFAAGDSADRWNFDLVSKKSSRLNRFIRKNGEEKIGSRVILPGAAELWRAGKAPNFR